MLHKNLIHLILVLLSLFILNNLHAQNSYEQLWGTWDLDTIEMTRQGVTEIHSLESLYADKENLPRNMFTQFYFFSNQIGGHNTESELVPSEDLNQKGYFSTDDGKLIITMGDEQPRIFTYIIKNDFLKIWYTQDDTQFYLVYKLSKL